MAILWAHHDKIVDAEIVPWYARTVQKEIGLEYNF